MSKVITLQGLSRFLAKCKDYFQQKLVSGTNIKTINNNSLLGNGNVPVGTVISEQIGTITDPSNSWYTKTEIDAMIGNIESLLAAI